jgi:hypothetical protein
VIFWALKKDTGLSQDYHVETYPTDRGVRVVFRTRGGFTVGAFVNERQDVDDTRPMTGLEAFDSVLFAEVLEYWSKP